MRMISTLADYALGAAGMAGAAWAKDPHYASIPISIEVNKPAAEVWAKAGAEYCGIKSWIAARREAPCEIRSGSGEVGPCARSADASPKS